MRIVLMSEKGHVAIPQEIRKRLRIAKGDPLVVELDSQGGIRLRVAAVLPMETYSEGRLREFEKEDALTSLEQKKNSKSVEYLNTTRGRGASGVRPMLWRRSGW